MTEIQPAAVPEAHSTIGVLAASAGAVGSGAKMVGSAAFTPLLLVCAVRTPAAGDWLSGVVATLMTIGLALVTRLVPSAPRGRRPSAIATILILSCPT